MAQTFYITTAISYPNGVPHVGHAYEAIAADAIARFERCDGKDVFFLTGTDEHGLKMKQTAAKEGVSPRDFADRNSARFREMANVLNLSNDDFIRTTEPRHYESCAELWRRMEKAGDIFKKNYGGWYSVRDESFYKEAETEVRDGVRYATPTGTPVEWTEEETYFFRLSKFEKPLIEHYEANPDFDPLTAEEIQAIDKIDKNCRLIKGQVFLWKDGQTWEYPWDLNGEITPP